jgi:hypothetical protein
MAKDAATAAAANSSQSTEGDYIEPSENTSTITQASEEEDESTPAPEIINNENMSTEEKTAAVANDFVAKNPDATDEDVAEVTQIVAEGESSDQVIDDSDDLVLLAERDRGRGVPSVPSKPPVRAVPGNRLLTVPSVPSKPPVTTVPSKPPVTTVPSVPSTPEVIGIDQDPPTTGPGTPEVIGKIGPPLTVPSVPSTPEIIRIIPDQNPPTTGQPTEAEKIMETGGLKSASTITQPSEEEDESTPASEIINNSNMSTEEKSDAVVSDFVAKNPDATEEDIAEVGQIVLEGETSSDQVNEDSDDIQTSTENTSTIAGRIIDAETPDFDGPRKGVEKAIPNQVEEDSDDMVDTFEDQSAEDTMSDQKDGDYDDEELAGFTDNLAAALANSSIFG